MMIALISVQKCKHYYNEMVENIKAKGTQMARLESFISALKKQIDEFIPDLWGSMVEFVMVDRNKEIKVAFRDGNDGIGE